jgi:hypothetical protein
VCLLGVLVVLGGWCQAAEYGGGTGDPNNPYQIWTAEQMNTIGVNSADWDKCFILMDDIDMSAYTGTQYNIIGRVSPYFTGSFDGNGHVIRNLTYTTMEMINNASFFGVTDNASIKNLGLENVNVSTGGWIAAGLVGTQKGGIITDCYSTGSVDCSPSSPSSYIGFSYMGGLVGLLSSGTITNCYCMSFVSSSSYNSDYSYIGGFAGKQESGIIANCYSTGSVTIYGAEWSCGGGLIGIQESGAIVKCYSACSVTVSDAGWSWGGGLIGEQASGTVMNCYSTGWVVSNCGWNYVGGLVGEQSGSSVIEKSYAAGYISASGNFIEKGGLLGSGNGNAVNSFWDKQTSGQNISAGGTGKTTAEMKTLMTFISAGWDFTEDDDDPVVWYLQLNNYPELTWSNQAIVPAITGLTQADAQSAINSAELCVGSVTKIYNDSVPSGDVISQAYPAGQTVLIGTSINFVVSLGIIPVYGGGSGTAADPYQIWTAEQMNDIGANTKDWDKCFILMDDIDMSAYTGTQYNIIGRTSPYFTGTFDGNGHVIRNLTYTTTAATNFVGLFGYISRGVIKNLGLENANLSSGGAGIGGLAGYVASQSTILDCYTTGQINGTGISNSLSKNYVGGLAGVNLGTISYCYSTCLVDSRGVGVGGLAGGNVGFIGGCYSTGSVCGVSYVGGLVGISGYDMGLSSSITGTITGCYSTGSVSGSGTCIGGLAGINNAGPNSGSASLITKCYSTGNVTAISSLQWRIGGLVGGNGQGNSMPCKAIIRDCYSTGNVSTSGENQYLGGLAGSNEGGYIEQSCSMGSVNTPNSTYIGGLSGVNYMSNIQDCYSTGSVSGRLYVGGLVGDLHTCTITNSYSTGSVIGKSYVGGLLGHLSGGTITVTNCFWDKETSGLTTSVRGTGKTTAEMKTLSTFTELTGRVEGYSGNALSFDGSAGYVEIPGYDPIASGSPGAITMWIKTSGNSINQVLMWRGQKSSKGYPWIYIAPAGNIGAMGFAGSQVVTDGQWHHIAVTMTETRQGAIYIDGQLDTTGSCSISSIQDKSLYLGVGMLTDFSYYFKGLMDDVRVYDRDLDAGEILPGNLPASGLAAHWAMDETLGAVAYDSLSNHHGRLRNIAWDFLNGSDDDLEHIWVIREGLEYPRFVWEIQQEITDSRDGLIALGFITANKTRVGRTTFEYELGVIVQNSKVFDMTNVQMQLMEWDTAVQSVSDDSLTIDAIPAGATVTSTDTFKIVVDRSTLITSSRLTWKLAYYDSSGQVQQAQMTMSLSGIDTIPGDITGDGKVNLEDFVIMARQWDNAPGNPSADILPPLNGHVGIEDLIYLAENWLK